MARSSLLTAPIKRGSFFRELKQLDDAFGTVSGHSHDGTDSRTISASVTLDQAYDSGGAGLGRTINATDGAVVIQNTQADTTNILEINKSPSAGAAGAGIEITMGGNATGVGISFVNAGSGADLLGTSSTWSISKAGVGVLVSLSSGAVSLTEGTAPAGTVAYIVRDNTGDTTINALTGKAVHVAINGSDIANVSSTGLAITGLLSTTTSVTVGNALTVTLGGATIAAGGLVVSASGAAITGNSTITGDLVITGSLTFGGNWTVGATLTVDELILDTDGAQPAGTLCYWVRDNGGDLTGNAITGKTINLAVNNTDEYVFSATVADFNDNAIDNCGYLILNAATAPAGTEVYAVNDNTGDLTVNALTGKAFNVAVNGTDEYTFSATVADFNANALDNCGYLILNAATAPAGTEVYAVNDNTGDLTVNAVTGKGFNIAIAGTDEIQLTAAAYLFNQAGSDRDFRIRSGIAYAIYSDGAKNSLVLGSNTDTSSVDQLITVSRALRTATATVNYYDFAIQPAGAVTVPAGTTAIVATMYLAEPNITATGTVTAAATLYIAGAPTEGGTSNHAINVVSGSVNFAGTAAIGGAATVGGTLGITGATTVTGGLIVPDNVLLNLGTTLDIVAVLSSAGLAANTTLAGVVVGSPTTRAVQANSLILGNITTDGDIMVVGQTGGNTFSILTADVSANVLYVDTSLTMGVNQTVILPAGAGYIYLQDGVQLQCGTGGDLLVSHDGTDNLIATRAILGTAFSTKFNMPIGAGGAANAALWWAFQLDTVTEAGLYGETDGAGSYTAATPIWKVPYRDSGANVTVPATPNAYQDGGLRVEAGNDTERIYFIANAGWKYVTKTGGLSCLPEERTDPNGHYFEVGDELKLRVDKVFADGAFHAIPVFEN